MRLKAEIKNSCPHARFQEVRAGLSSHYSHPSFGEAAGSEIAFTSVRPLPPGIGAECFLLEKQKNQSRCRKPKSSFLLPLACPLLSGAKGRGCRQRVLTARQEPPGETWTASVICPEANAASALRCGTLGFLQRGGPPLSGQAALGAPATPLSPTPGSAQSSGRQTH